MAVIRQEDVQKLLDQIELLRKFIKPNDERGRAMSIAIDLPLLNAKQELGIDDAGKIQKIVWDALTQDGREALYQRLFILVERLTRAVVPDTEGPPPFPKSIMYYKHAPDWAIWAVLAGAIVLTLGVLWEISGRWEKATTREFIANVEGRKSEPASRSSPPQSSSPEGGPIEGPPAKTQPGAAVPSSKAAVNSSAAGSPTPKGPISSKSVDPSLTPQAALQTPKLNPLIIGGEQTNNASIREPATELDVLIMVMLMGALGGLLRLISSFAKYIGNRQLLQSWMIYYILMPLESAALAPLVYLLLRVGVLAPAQLNGSPLNMNLYGIYAIAGMTGLFSKQAMDMLAEVFAVIFRKVQAKDDLDVAKEKKESHGVKNA